MRPDDASLLTPDERLREVARLLAQGVLRLQVRAALDTAAAAEKPGKNVDSGLDVPRQ